MGKKKSMKLLTGFILFIFVLIVSLVTFAVWNMAYQGSKDIVGLFGITNVYLQFLVIIVFGLIVIFLLSRLNKRIKLKKAVKDILKL